MNPSEIWSFPLDDGSNGLLRVILRVKDLHLARLEPMLLLREDSVLVQITKISALTEKAFDQENLLLNGVLISALRNAKKLGFKKVAEGQVSIENIEFPGWFMNGRYHPVFCRGEVQYEISSHTFEFIHENWRILLLGSSGIDRLAGRISKYNEYLEGIKFGNLKKGWVDDVRYNAKRDEILKAIGVSFDEPYYKVLAEKLGEERLNIYKQAITPAPKKD